MSRVLGIVGIYLAIFLAWIAAGLFMLLAPMRFGNLLHNSFGLCPEVRPKDWGRKLILRIIGIGLLGFAWYFALRIAVLIREGG